MKIKGFFDSFIKKLKSDKMTLTLACVAGVLVVLLVAMILIFALGKKDDVQPTEPSTAETEATQAPTTPPTEPSTELPTEPVTEPTVPEPTELVILPELEELYAQNPDLAGWITIPDTIVDYPVMFTPDDGDKYLYKNIKGKFDVNGLPFVEDSCKMLPESDNIIIYGHNMKSGKMFHSLMEYADEKYWEEHPTIIFSTLYEEREYEIVAAFYDRVYYNYENCFKFYQFIDAKDEEHYMEAISYFKEKAEYETGVTAEYGDRLITLVTCAYHVKNGRFVVVAREVPENPDAA